MVLPVRKKYLGIKEGELAAEQKPGNLEFSVEFYGQCSRYVKLPTDY
jgi:hypothetical protein